MMLEVGDLVEFCDISGDMRCARVTEVDPTVIYAMVGLQLDDEFIETPIFIDQVDRLVRVGGVNSPI